MAGAGGAQEARGHRRREAGRDHCLNESTAGESPARDLCDELTDHVFVHVEPPSCGIGIWPPLRQHSCFVIRKMTKGSNPHPDWDDRKGRDMSQSDMGMESGKASET
jgi:hypothetical protein